MARYQDLYAQMAGLAPAPDIQRMRAQAQALRQTPSPQGQMISGRFAAPHWTQNLASTGSRILGSYISNKADEQQQEYMSELSQALRGTDSPQYVMDPGYQQPTLDQRLADIADENPYAQQILMQQAMQGDTDQWKTLTPDDAAELGLDPQKTWQMSPDQQLKVIDEPDKPPTSIREYEYAKQQGFQGSFQDYQTQKAEAGADRVSVGPIGSDDMWTEQGKKLGQYIGDEFIRIQEQAQEASKQNAQLDRIEQLLEGVRTGRGMPTLTEIQGLASTFGVELGDDLGQKEAAQSLTNQMALRFRSPESGLGLPGATSERDIAFLKSFPPGIQQSPEGRQLITETFRRVNKKKQRVAQKALELVKENQRQGINGLTWEDMDTLQNMWAEPMFEEDFIKRARDVSGADVSQPSTGDEELDSLLDKYAPQ